MMIFQPDAALTFIASSRVRVAASHSPLLCYFPGETDIT
jgi:hypothetical protein